jgi:CheY-like chemotaxis protein/nitrogen-specific signal transduction histidine kinase
VVQRTQELEASLHRLEVANAQLREADQARSRFLSSLSHELRTPLNSILGFSDLMRGQYFGPLNEKQVGYVQQIEHSGKHLLSLINDLLDLARIDAGGMTVEATVIPTQDLLQSTVAMISTQFAEKRIMLETEVAPDTSDLLADPRRGKQVLLNLLSNAVKYTPEGGCVWVHARDDGESHVRVEVRDNGIGIDPAETERIFAEFHQADRVRDGQFGGTGIGLALSKRLVEIQGGRIGVESTPGEGTTFWFTLPSHGGGGDGSDEAEGERRRSRHALRGRRILVAEDNEVNLSVLLDMLSLQEHEVTVARNGQEALELARSTNPELILIDIRMPVMDGLEATRRLRAMGEFASVPIVALTASTGAEAEQEQLRAGITEHLAKPFRAEALFDVLQRHLGRSGRQL